MTNIDNICSSLLRGERLSAGDALVLWREAPLWLLGELACVAKRRVSGNKVYYNRNFHIEPTNQCAFSCRFCSYRRSADSPEMWDHTPEEIEEEVRSRAGSGAGEVHIVGGAHPDRGVEYLAEIIRRVRKAMPQATVKAFTAVELHYAINKSGMTVSEGLKMLRQAGLDAIPGGGAEIFDEEIRRRICPEKCSADEWLAIHAEAHKMGIRTNATMLYGHIESVEQRIDHLVRLREQQDATGGFDAFVPLKYRSSGNALGEVAGEVPVTDDLRTLAMSRLILDNIPHIKAYWVMYGKRIAEMALAFGADDIDGTIDDSTKIYSMAGAEEQHPTLTLSEIERMAANAGLQAVERDTFYNEIEPSNGMNANSGTNGPRTTQRPAQRPVHKPVQRPAQNPASKSKNKNPKTVSQGCLLTLKHLCCIAAVLALLFVVVYFLMQWGTRHDSRRTVPDFIGMTFDGAVRAAGENGLEVEVSDSLYVSGYAGGTVLEQLPEGGVEVKPGRTIYVTINAFNQKIVKIPYVAERTLRQAKSMLEAAGIEIAYIEYVNDIAPNYVLAEYYNGTPVTPESNVEGAIGTGVTLRVGMDENNRTTSVPKLVGLPLPRAKSLLWENGLNVDNVTYDAGVSRAERSNARVWFQSLDYGRRVSLGSKVSLKLTTDEEKITSSSSSSESMAVSIREEQEREEAIQRMVADSVARAEAELIDAESEDSVDDFFYNGDNFFM